MRGFSTPPTESITLTAGAESLDLSLAYLPVGYLAMLETRWGLEAGSDDREANRTLNMACLARALRGNGLETQAQDFTTGADFLAAFTAELAAAHLADVHVQALLLKMNEMNIHRSEAGGNGSRPASSAATG